MITGGINVQIVGHHNSVTQVHCHRLCCNCSADAKVKYEMASNEVKESIQRRAKIYDFTCEGAIEKFWESINFDEIKPAQSIYESLENVIDERARR